MTLTDCTGMNIPTEPVISAGMTIIPTLFCAGDSCPTNVSMCSAANYCSTITDLDFTTATSAADNTLCEHGCDILTSLEIPLITTLPADFLKTIHAPTLLTSIDISSLTAMPATFCVGCSNLTTFYTNNLTLLDPLLSTVINGNFTINDLITF